MAGDAKYGRLFTQRDVELIYGRVWESGLGRLVDELEGEGKLTFPADEPLFLLRGQDAVTGPTVAAYTLGLINMDGMADADPHVQAAQAARLRIEEWQREHPDRVKAPD